MSMFSHLQNSFAQAQSLLAQAQGMASGAAGNFTLAGESRTGVLNLTNAEMQPSPNGFVRIENLEIAATRDQFPAKPNPVPRIAVQALGRAWWCTKVGESGIHYFLTCVPA